MSVERIKWVGDRVHIDLHLFDPDGIHETIILYPTEALAILFWLEQERKKLLDLYTDTIRKDIVT